jgi:hypothetical protein
MNARKSRQSGFIMLVIIVILAMIGMYMIVLTSDSNILGFQADRAYLEACQQNLTASGLNWTKKNIDTSKMATGPIELGTSDMGIKNAVLRVKLITTENGKSQVEIETSCSKARQRLSSVKKFTIETRLQ